MNDDLGAGEPSLRSPAEPLTLRGEVTGLTPGEFWACNGSDLLDNALRGKLAEFIVARGVGAVSAVRSEWDPYDLMAPNGAKIEVKSAAHVQSWHQERHSSISFRVARRLTWNPSANRFGTEQIRSADVYMFCVLHHRDQATIKPLELDQWTYYVAPTRLLGERFGAQNAVSLRALTGAGIEGCGYESLEKGVCKAFDVHRA